LLWHWGCVSRPQGGRELRNWNLKKHNAYRLQFGSPLPLLSILFGCNQNVGNWLIYQKKRCSRAQRSVTSNARCANGSTVSVQYKISQLQAMNGNSTVPTLGTSLLDPRGKIFRFVPQACHAAKASGVVVQYSKYMGCPQRSSPSPSPSLTILANKKRTVLLLRSGRSLPLFQTLGAAASRAACAVTIDSDRESDCPRRYCFARVQVVLFDRGTSISSQFIGKPVMQPLDHRQQFGFSAALRLPLGFKYRSPPSATSPSSHTELCCGNKLKK
jgi:hypothetical protein